MTAPVFSDASGGDMRDAAAGVQLRSDRFRLEREADWLRLDQIVTHMEKGRRRKLSDADVLDLPALYRTAMSSLSIARENSLDAGLIAYLEALTLRAYFLVYGTQTTFIGWCRDFFGGGWSRAVRAIWPEIAIALLVMVAGAVTGYFMVAHNPDWFYALLDENLAGGRVPGASEAMLRQSLFGNAEQSGMAVFAAELFSNNAQVAIMAFALGFAFGIPSILLLIQNMAMMGALLWVFGSRGLMFDFAGWLSIHGTTELFAILLAGAAGLHIGRAIAFPGRLSHLQAASDAGKRAALVMMGVVLMLVVAGLLEGFGRQLVDNTPGRFATGGVMLTLWLAYFAFAGRRQP